MQHIQGVLRALYQGQERLGGARPRALRHPQGGIPECGNRDARMSSNGEQSGRSRAEHSKADQGSRGEKHTDESRGSRAASAASGTSAFIIAAS